MNPNALRDTDPDPERRYRVREALLEISNYVGSVMRRDEILNHILQITMRVMGGDSSSIYLWNDDRTRLVMRCNIGLEPELIGAAGFDAGRGIPGWVAEHGEIVSLADGNADPRYDPIPSVLQRGFKGYLCAPLRIQEDIIGVMVLRTTPAHEFSDDEKTVFQTICKMVAIVLEKARMHEARVEAERLAAVAVSLSGVAHYIKNLLTTMKGAEYVIESALKREDIVQARNGWRILQRSTSKIRDLVENMLAYYRDSHIHPVPTDLNERILETMHDLEDRAMQRNTILDPDLDLRIGKVPFDPSAIQDVLINLITNAIDAIPEGRPGRIAVQSRLCEADGQVRVGVRDNGSGIPAEDMDKIFNLFHSTKGNRGTGIGLAASRKLILEHHGTIGFDSKEGEGTEFHFFLPLKQP